MDSASLCQTSIAAFVASLCVSAAFLSSVPLRLYALRHHHVKIQANWLGYLKLIASPALAIIITAQLALVLGFSRSEPDKLEAVTLSVSLVASLAYIGLSAAEHRLAVKPSNLAVLYLLTTAGCNVLQLTFPQAARAAALGGPTGAKLLTVEVFARLALLSFESLNKISILKPKFKSLPPEEAAGLLSRAFFWWLTDTLILGTKRLLSNEDIPHPPKEYRGKPRRAAILEKWDQRDKPETNFTLLKTLARCLKFPILSPALPRLCLIGFRCSQPVLIRQAMSFLSPTLESDRDACTGRGLLLAAVLVYFGLSITTALYQHRLNRLRLMMRGSLVTLVYDKALNIGINVSDTGKVLTIMSTDIDSACGAGAMFHETWAKLIELVIGIVLLAQEIGWLWLVPLAIIFLSSKVSQFVAQNIRARQKRWNMATQARISALSTILGSMKSVKAMGLSGFLGDYVTGLRKEEIDSSKHVRWMNVVYNASANAVGMFTPVITIVLFATIATVHHTQLDARTAFTTLAILALVTHSANMVMTIVPRAIATFANVERIQAYMLEPSRVDQRKHCRNESTTLVHGDQPAAIRLSDITVQFDNMESPTLWGISMTLSKGSMTICSGHTGSGKSTLAKVILGEVAPVTGTAIVPSLRIAYCDQKPWIPTGTVKEIICAFEKNINMQLYQDTLRATCLDHDLERLPSGDNTVIGTRGVNLSGGQRQRLALARLLYSQPSVAILDDPFSALDGNTESSVVNHLLGPEGWFKKAGITVFIISNSAQHFQIADHIVLIENGTIKSQGSWDRIKSHATEIQKFTFHDVKSKAVSIGTDSDAAKPTAKLANRDDEEDLRRRTGDISLYAYYLKAAGAWNSILLVACTASCSFFITFTTYWLKWWTNSEGDRTAFYITGYFLIALAAWVSTNGIMSSTFMLVAPRSGSKLHKALLNAIFGASLSFFVSTDVGVTVNRFSQDISLVDRELPNDFSALCAQIFKMATQVTILLHVQKLLLLTLPVCIIIVYFVQKAYLQTSRQLRVLELESRSSLYSWFLETVDGVVTIRSFGWQASSTARNLANLDYSLRPSYALLCLKCWLSLILELIVSFIAVAIIAIAVKWRGGTSQADIGLSLNLILVANSTLVRLVETWTSVEVSLGAISRLRDAVMNTPQEDKPWEDNEPDNSWPTNGNVQVTQLSAGYDSNSMILKNINLNATEGQKLVICGRTGSGKSTVVLSLLRLIESSGAMEVDGVSLATVPRSVVRHRCFITIPQEPFFLHEESLRFNLDPSGAAPDKVLQSALAKVGMWTRLCGNEGETDLLSRRLSSLPAVSVGQLQLLAMARAIAKKDVLSFSTEYRDDDGLPVAKPILLLDEATSSLDSTTESEIYDIIESEFVQNGHTVIIVAHRVGALSARMRSGRDSVAWVQDGRVLSVGSYEEFAQEEAKQRVQMLGNRTCSSP